MFRGKRAACSSERPVVSDIVKELRADDSLSLTLAPERRLVVLGPVQILLEAPCTASVPRVCVGGSGVCTSGCRKKCSRSTLGSDSARSIVSLELKLATTMMTPSSSTTYVSHADLTANGSL